MRHGTSTSTDIKSRLRLRVGVLLILLWLIPFWALAPHIAHSLGGLSNPPSVEAVTAAIVVVQTIVGLLGFWVAGTEVESIIRGSTTKHALGAIWSIFIHGKAHVPTTSALIWMKATHRRSTPSLLRSEFARHGC
jgi:hypothetical protein